MTPISRFAIPLAFLFAAPASAADIKVISAGAVRGLIAGIIADYSRETGHKFEFKVGTTGQLRAIIASGEPADLIIASAPLMAELEKSEKMTPGSRADLGRVGIGVAIRDGASAPDVSTPEAFKQALIDARSVAYTDPREGGNVQHLPHGRAGAFGLVNVVTRKAALSNGGRDAVEKVARGEAEIAVTLISEICRSKAPGWRRRCRSRCSSIPSMPPRSRRAAPIPPRRAPSSPRSPGRPWRSAGRPRASSRPSNLRNK